MAPQLPIALMGLAAGAGAGASQGSRGRHPMGFGEAFSGGLASGLNTYGLLGQMQRDQMADRMRMMQFANQARQQQQAREQEAQRQQTLSQIAQDLPEADRRLMQLDPDAFSQAWIKKRFAEPSTKAPTVKDFYDPERKQTVKKQWDPQQQDWIEVGLGMPSGTDATALESNARFIAKVTGRPLKEAAEMMVASASNRLSPDALWADVYKRQLRQLGATHDSATEAANNAVGMLFPDWTAPGRPPEPETPPGTAEAATGEFSIFNPTTWFGGGGEETPLAEPAAPQQPAAPGMPRPSPARPQQQAQRPARQQGQAAEPMELSRGQALERESLTVGQTYRFPDGTQARWTGRDFVVVEGQR